MAAITRNQSKVLVALIKHKYPEMNGVQVTKATGITAVQVGKLLDELRIAGLVKLLSAGPDDGNAKFYTLTKRGQAITRKLIALRKALQTASTAF